MRKRASELRAERAGPQLLLAMSEGPQAQLLPAPSTTPGAGPETRPLRAVGRAPLRAVGGAAPTTEVDGRWISSGRAAAEPLSFVPLS